MAERQVSLFSPRAGRGYFGGFCLIRGAAVCAQQNLTSRGKLHYTALFWDRPARVRRLIGRNLDL